MAGSQKKFYWALGVIALAGAGLIGYAMTRGGADASPDAVSVQPAADPAAMVGLDVGVARGSADAPVTLEEYIDYQCPYCAIVSRLTIPDVIDRYVETGKVRYIVFDFPVHPGDKSYLAAEAARCAGDQDAFWPMHDLLFNRMSEWAAERNPTGKFSDYARAMGLDAGAFEGCMDRRKYREVVQANRRRAEQLGLTSTPSFIIDGERRITGAVGFDRLASIIEEELPPQ